MKVTPISVVVVALGSLSLPACHGVHAQEHHQGEQNKIVVTSPLAKDIDVTQQYVCQIRSRRNIAVRSLQNGYLEAIPVKEGQTVEEGEVLFRVVPILFRARLDAETAEVRLAQIKYDNTQRLYEQKVVSIQEVAQYEAELAKAKAKLKLAEAEFNFTTVKAPFAGIIDRLHEQQGSLIKEGDVLTNLSDNKVMWVYFNVPEARYLEYMAARDRREEDPLVELVLADGTRFKHTAAKYLTVEGQFNNETGNIPFRADFDNPENLLRHGQTGTVVLHRTVKNAVLIPQRATFEVLDKRYVFVVGDDHVVHQRLITVQTELEDVFVIKSGVTVNERIILEGVRQVHEGQRLETGPDHYEYCKPEEALADLKTHAE